MSERRMTGHNRVVLASIRRRFSDRVDDRVEQRAFERFPIGLKTNIVAVDAAALPRPLRVELVDISGGGIRLRVDQHHDAGSQLSVTFTLPGEGRTNDAQVEVLSSEQTGSDFVARCRFTELRMGGQLLDWTLARMAGKRR
jgi:hypothetical protein